MYITFTPGKIDEKVASLKVSSKLTDSVTLPLGRTKSDGKIIVE